jgi:hypothetical protein
MYEPPLCIWATYSAAALISGSFRQQASEGRTRDIQYKVISDKETKGFIVRFEVFTAVTMKDVVFWDVKP